MKNVLIVGCGAVGKVYGYHLARGGASITYLVKPEHIPRIPDQIKMYQMSWLERFYSRDASKVIKRFTDFSLLTMDAIEGHSFDFVLLTTSSTSISTETQWLLTLVQTVRPKVLVSYLPGKEDYSRVCVILEESGVPIAQGALVLASYPTPLSVERINAPAGAIAYLLLGPQAIQATGKSTLEIVDLLASTMTRGGMSCQTSCHEQVGGTGQMIGLSIFTPFLVGLANVNWKLARVTDIDSASLIVRSSKQLLRAAAEKETSSTARFVLRLIAFLHTTYLLRFLVYLLPKITPFDLESFLAYHFSKIATQNELFCNDFIDEFKECNISDFVALCSIKKRC